MEIVIKQNLCLSAKSDQEILNIFYGENTEYLKNWILTYISNDIFDSNLEEFDLSIEERGSVYYVVKTMKVLVKGYVFNKYEQVKEDVYLIKVLEFNGGNSIINSLVSKVKEGSKLWKGINSEITHQVLQKCDRDSLYQIILALESAIKSKEIWNSTELIMTENQITKNFKKELYSNIVRKVKKNKQSQGNLIKKNQYQSNSIPSSSGLPEQIKWNDSVCKLEYTKLN
jgi:hypothetical protein